MLSTYLCLAQRLRMSGAIPQIPLHAFMAWTGTILSFIHKNWTKNTKNNTAETHSVHWFFFTYLRLTFPSLGPHSEITNLRKVLFFSSSFLLVARWWVFYFSIHFLPLWESQNVHTQYQLEKGGTYGVPHRTMFVGHGDRALLKPITPAGKGYLFVMLSWMAEVRYRMTFELLLAV